MKKIFLIPLMALMSCVMAWGTTIQVGDYQALEDAFDNAANGDVIEMTQDITIPVSFYNDGHMYNITKSITFDGKGYTLTGYSRRGSNRTTIAINQGGSNFVSVVFKDLIIRNAGANGRPIELRGNISSFTLDNVKIYATGSGNPQGLTVGGNQTSSAEITISNSVISVGSAGYPIISFNPYHLVATNTTFSGYCGLYLRGIDGSAGSRGTVIDAENCTFECPNVHSGKSNAFSCFPLEDDGITINLHNCGMNIEQVGDQNQALVTVNNNSVGRREYPVYIIISGDNSHFNTKGGMNKTIQNLWIQGKNPETNKIEIIQGDFPEIVFVLEGGTYSVNPTEDMLYYGSWVKDEDTGEYTGNIHIWGPTIPDGYTISEVQQDGKTLYRVHKSAASYVDPGTSETVLYDLNDNVENIAAGENPVTSFELSTGAEMALNQETTTAGYVQVKNSDSADPATATVVKVGKTETVGSEEQKVDQVLYISQGLDVLENAQVEVQAGSALIIGDGGITTSSEESIVLGADKDGCASLLLHPDIEVNQQPELTIKMQAKEVGYEDLGGYRDWYFHRFALPVESASSSTITKVPNHGVYLYGWDYAINNWSDPLAWNQLRPFYGYSMAPDAEYGDMTITIKGQLVGNTDRTLEFSRGYNFFGNSYTGYISVLKLISMLGADENIDGTVWMWNSDLQTYGAVPLGGLQRNPARFDAWQKEVAPMQTFVLRLVGAENGSADLSYAEAIWGNPRYSAFTGVAAPAMRNSVSDDTFFRITVRSDNGRADAVDFTEDMQFSDAYDKSYDAVKYMNGGCVNMYTALNGERYTSVATDNIEGKRLTLETVGSYNYTLSFSHVSGTEYALRDNVTGAVTPIVEGNMYSFVAQPNSTAEGRFEIVPVRTMPTAVENAEAVPAAKGIYSMQGQYLGNDLNVLPAGVYVVDGVRIVK